MLGVQNAWGIGVKHLIRGNSGEKEELLGAQAEDS